MCVCVCVGGGGGADNVLFLVINRFLHRAVRALLEKQLDPLGPYLLLEGAGVLTSISKETDSHLRFSSGEGVQTPVPPPDSPFFFTKYLLKIYCHSAIVLVLLEECLKTYLLKYVHCYITN